MSSILPEGLTERPATMDDLEIIYRLSLAHDLAMYGEEEFTREDLQIRFSEREVKLAEDSRLIFTRDGQLVGFLLLSHQMHAKYFALLRVVPDYSDERVGDYLLALAKRWTRERVEQAEPGVRVSLSCWMPSNDQRALERCKRADFREVRRNWRMEIDLREEPDAPVWPDGVELRPFVPGRDDYAVYKAVDTAFTDHWGHISHPFEMWKHWTVERESFDPSLWFIAWGGNEVAGTALCLFEGEVGWVDDLAVQRPWRRKGLGMALLKHAFGAFYRQGKRRAALNVDSQNLTGAVRLYERAGMHRARETITYEKELRTGVELSTQTLAV